MFNFHTLRYGLCVIGALATPATVSAATETVLRGFGGLNDGDPLGGVTLDSAGNIYGTSFGSIYSLTPSGVFTVLEQTGNGEGNNPVAPPVLDPLIPGMLFGTTEAGGPFITSGAGGKGLVYAQPAGTAGGERKLHVFKGGTDGAFPTTRLAVDAAGNLYGSTRDGRHSKGTVFELSVAGQYRVVHAFSGPDGDNPVGALTVGPDGTLFGTTQFGGARDGGTIFSIAADGTFSTLYSFPIRSAASGGVYRDGGGNLYGVTAGGGTYGYGTLYRLAPDGTFELLHSFGAAGDGVLPNGTPVADAGGTVYGVTTYGGAAGYGTVFAFSPTLGETVFFAFTDYSQGFYPSLTGGGLAIDLAGALYGTTIYGGNAGGGVLFKIVP